MSKKNKVDNVVSEIITKTPEEAITDFAQITQQEMQDEANQPDDMLKLPEGEFRLVAFRKKGIRSVIHDNAWWFSVIDVIEAVVDTKRPRQYWSDLKKKLEKEGFFGIIKKCRAGLYILLFKNKRLC